MNQFPPGSGGDQPPQWQPPPPPPPQHYQQPQPMMPAPYGQPVMLVKPPNPKDKTPAVLLAVFLGFWTWLYTYDRDNWKFWLNLGLTVVTLGLWGFVAWIWAIIDVSVKPNEWYHRFPNG